MTHRFLLRHTLVFLAAGFYHYALFAQHQPFQPASHQAVDISARIEKIDARLQRDLAALPEVPKAQKTALVKEYTERSDTVKSMLRSGEFLMDSVWRNWFEGILQEIWRGNPELPAAEISFYIGREEEPNACSIGEGTIIFNVGMMPFLKTESQVAVIICHEIAHYVRQHSNQAIDQYVTNLYSRETQQKLKTISRNRVNRTEKAATLLKSITYNHRRHSRFKESEADSLGLVFLCNTGYATTSALDVLQILDSIDNLSWEPIAYKKLLDNPQMPFQDSWLQEPPKSSLASPSEGFENIHSDSLKTHPDCKKRMALIGLQMEDKPHKGQAFLQEPARFERLKMLSNYEIVTSLYESGAYGRCLYRTLLQLQQNPEDVYLSAMVIKCLYYIHQYQAAHALRQVLDLPRPGYSTEYKRYLQFVNQLQLQEIAKIGYYFCENRLEKFNANEDFIFAAALASKMNQRSEEFNTRKNQYLNQFPQGRFNTTLLNIND